MNLAIPTAENEESPNQIRSIDLDRFGSIRGQECRVGLEIGFRSLSLREGSFQHGDVLEWDSKYAKNKGFQRFMQSEILLLLFWRSPRTMRGVLEAALVQKNPQKKGVVLFLLRAKMSL